MATPTTKRKPAATKVKEVGPLDHLIPEKIFADEYIPRVIEGIRDADLLRYANDAGNNVLIYGPTGPGKTSLVLAYAAEDRKPVATVQCNGAVDPNTFWGSWQPDALGRLEWVYSEITEVIRHGGVLYLDEVNFLPPKVAAVFHGLLDKRRQITIPERGNEVIKAHPGLLIICSYNPDYEGTRPLNPAFKNRFKMKLRFDYEPAVEKELVCVPVMLDLATKLRTQHKTGELDTPVSTNMLIEFEELAVDLGLAFAKENFLNAFTEEERGAVEEVFNNHYDKIAKQVKEMEEMAASDA